MFLRSFLILAAWLCYYTAARDLQLAEMTTIYYAAPIIVTVLSIFMLGRRCRSARWAAVAIGFVGVFIACDPASLGLSLPVLLVLAAAFCGGCRSCSCARSRPGKDDRADGPQQRLLPGHRRRAAALSLDRRRRCGELRLLLGAGALAGFAQFTLFEGMKRAPASVIAPFEYTALVWAFLLGFLIWGDVPRGEVFSARR